MFRHLLKISIRNLTKTKLHSFINVLGLSLGIACSILIILFVKDELTFDNFHSKKENLYRLYYEAERMDGSMINQSVVPMIMGPTIMEDYPEVVETTIWFSNSYQVTVGDESYEESVNMAGAAFFRMFDFEVHSGSVEKVLETPTDIVITRKMADKYFGDDEVVGQNLQIVLGAESRDFEVKAVLENIPSNSSFQFDFLISDLLAKENLPEDMLTSWNFVSAEGYIMLEAGSDKTELEAKLPTMVDRVLGEDLNGRKFEIGLQPITEIHLDTELSKGIAQVSDPKYTVILSGISLLILAMACINFMNLSLGRSMSRAREIGIKKVVGAVRNQLMIQFLAEAVFLSLVSLVGGIIMAFWALPVFNELAGKELLFDMGGSNLIIFLSLSIFVGLLAGFYPAIIMSGFKPVSILKGRHIVGGGKNILRLVMITFQLVLSIFLITSALFMKSQLNYIQNKNLGFNQDQILVVPMTTHNSIGIRDALDEGMELAERGRPIIEALPSVENVGISSHTFEEGGWMQLGYLDANQTMQEFFMNKVDAHYIDVMKMEILDGRNFNPDNESDKRRSVIVNEAFVREFGLESPVGSKIPHEKFDDHEIIGVVKDFNFASLHTTIDPLILVYNHNIGFSGISNMSLNSSIVAKLMVKLRAGELATGIDEIQDKWEEIYPGDPFNYSFMDDTIQAQYEREGNLDTIITFATILSVLIGSLGLFGLATLTMSARLKEMSIRKVLGAGQSSLIFTLSRSYLMLVIIASVLSIPLTYLFVNAWLQNFAFKIDIGFIPFMGGGFIILIISFITLAYQSIKIAISNPIDALRSE